MSALPRSALAIYGSRSSVPGEYLLCFCARCVSSARCVIPNKKGYGSHGQRFCPGTTASVLYHPGAFPRQAAMMRKAQQLERPGPAPIAPNSSHDYSRFYRERWLANLDRGRPLQSFAVEAGVGHANPSACSSKTADTLRLSRPRLRRSDPRRSAASFSLERMLRGRVADILR